MHTMELRRIADHEGIAHARTMSSNNELIRAIQNHRGETPCFMTEHRFTCRIQHCEWRGDCRKLIAVWRR